VIYYAEPACLETMIYLFNNNIRTTGNDTECVYGAKEENGKCTVRIDYDSLSEENKNIANYLISTNVAYFVGEPTNNNIEIQVPCSKNETVGAINEKLKSIAYQFVKQPILYGFFSRDQMLPEIIEWIKDDIVNDKLFPNGESCMELIENEKVKENPNGNLLLDDGRTFLIDDFVNVILQSILQSNEIFQSYIEYRGFYYDESEDKIWISEKLYKLYLKQMNIDQQQIL
jgi:hypothetical protein